MPSTNGRGPKRAILYARVSTDEQARSGFSLAQQLEALREHAAREEYEVLEEVSDPGQSGASLERPGVDRVRDLVAAEGVFVVLAQDRDRFAREPAYHYLLRREFEEHGIKVPVGEGLRLWTDLKRNGVEAKFLYFPDEHHWVAKPNNARIWCETVLCFVDHYGQGREWNSPDLL